MLFADIGRLKEWHALEEKRISMDLSVIGRSRPLFQEDMMQQEEKLSEMVRSSSFLVIGGAGTIGSAICRELFQRNPRVLHVVDLSENNMVELVRDIRSSVGYSDGEFATFAVDCGSDIFAALMEAQKRRIGGYDYVFNTSALKHVRSEKDPWTLMRMIDTNIFNTDRTMKQAWDMGAQKYFCVSTDKAANPVNMMGASKRIMEMFLARRSLEMPASTPLICNIACMTGTDGAILVMLRSLMTLLCSSTAFSLSPFWKASYISSSSSG